MNRLECLEAAIDAVSRRAGQYGPPEKNFGNIANKWRSYLSNKWSRDVYLDGVDVALMMIELKIERVRENPFHYDSWVDIAGYAAAGAEVACELEQINRDDCDFNINHHGEELV